jgi:hypothetical protein
MMPGRNNLMPKVPPSRHLPAGFQTASRSGRRRCHRHNLCGVQCQSGLRHLRLGQTAKRISSSLRSLSQIKNWCRTPSGILVTEFRKPTVWLAFGVLVRRDMCYADFTGDTVPARSSISKSAAVPTSVPRSSDNSWSRRQLVECGGTVLLRISTAYRSLPASNISNRQSHFGDHYRIGRLEKN